MEIPTCEQLLKMLPESAIRDNTVKKENAQPQAPQTADYMAHWQLAGLGRHWGIRGDPALWSSSAALFLSLQYEKEAKSTVVR